MSIQKDIESTLEEAIANKSEKFYIDELKFLKAELQRKKTKEISDKEATEILVGLYKSQLIVINEAGDDSPAAEVAYSLIANINDFLPEDVIEEINMSESDITDWIKSNVDMTKYSNKGMAIGFVKGRFKYVDGALIKEILDKI